MEADVPVVFCVGCLDWKPVEQFRRRSKGSERRHYECKACAAAYMREWRAEKRRQTFDKAISQLHRDRESPGQVEYLAAVVMAAFHGAAGFAAEYGRAFDAALAAGDHKAMLRYLIGWGDLMWVAERARARRKLAEEKRRLLRAMQQRSARRRDDY